MTGAVGEQRPRMATMGDDLIDREAALRAIQDVVAMLRENGLTPMSGDFAAAVLAIRALPSATQAVDENQALRAMIRVNLLRYGPADLTHDDIDRQIEAAIAAFAPRPPAPDVSAQREEARKG